ncbi:MAG: spore coat protein U domain-containing protein, partial [Alphaproteobacteria bacterium]|nr:spore coat protein U domain-containing protein [Alphaproteobacteria bacterium]
MRTLTLLGMCAVGILIFSHEVQAACDLRLGTVPQFRWQGEGSGYNPFDATTYNQEGKIDVRNRSGSCQYFVTVSEGNSSNFSRYMTQGGSRLNYNIYDDVSQSNVLKDLPTASVNEVISGAFSAADTQRLTYAVSIPPGQTLPSGTYRDQVKLRLYEGTLASNKFVASKTLRLRSGLPKVAEVSVVPTGSPFDEGATAYTVSFGVLQEGERERFDLLARSNAGYRILMSSGNRGVLERTGGASGVVPYTMTIDGRLVDLSRQSVTVATKNGVTGLGGDRFTIEVDIGTLADAVPGA